MQRLKRAAAGPAAPVRVSPRKKPRFNNPQADLDTVANGLRNSDLSEPEVLQTKSAKRTSSKTDPKPTTLLPTASPRPKTAFSAQKLAKYVQFELEQEPSNPKPKQRNPIEQARSTVKIEDQSEEKTDKKEGIEPHSGEETLLKHKGDQTVQKTIRKRKTKEEKEAEAMPLAARTPGLNMFVGAHVSIAKGVENAVTNCMHIGGNAFALFLKSQRKWDNPALKDENRDAFKHHCTRHNYDQSSHVVPHGSYLVNLASPDPDMSKKSYDAFVDDLRRCEAMGIKFYNFHPGSTNKEPLNEAIARLAGNLNRALAETSTVTPLLENMAGHGSIIGSRFSDLRDIIAAIKPEFKSRIGICIDTCHAFAAGYDLRTPEAFKKTFQELDTTVGLQYLRAMHINDSKAPFGSHRDLHQNIGVGFLGLRAFHNVMNDERLQNIPLILETPCDRPDPKDPKKTLDDKNVWAREIKLLESMIGMDPESEEFKSLEAELSERGRAEREKMESSIAARDEKARKKAQRELEKGQRSISSMFSGKGKKRKGSVSSQSSLSDVGSDA